MTAINFPDSPNINDTFSANSLTWQWNGTVWKAIPTPGYTGSFGYTGSSGYTGSQGAGYTGSQGDVSKAFAIAMAVGLS
jgi:hypothetical protein